jgi:dolichyl-phosphate-mannose--protein O-mannosyl transferase
VIRGLLKAVNQFANHPHFGWLSTLIITSVGAVFRFGNLSNPKVLVFDETYYVKDAYTLGLFGHEKQWVDDANPGFESGDLSGYLDTGAYVVHPPFGKWVIWVGMQLFGADDSFGWRFSVALLGTLAIPLIIAVARRLIGNRVFAAMAGLLLAIEGQSVVLARTAILDGVLAFFVLLSFYILVRDQQSWQRIVNQAAISGKKVPLAFRPWLLAMAITLGLASSVKWSGLYFLAAFGLWTFLSDWLSRQRLGLRPWGALLQAAINAILLIAIGLVTYVASWTGWLVSKGGWGRELGDNGLTSLWEYHKNAYGFHTGLSSEHPYASNAFQWLLSLRPTAFYYESFEGEACGYLSSCSVAITALPNLLIWIGGVVAMLWLFARVFKKVDLTSGLVLVGFLAGWAPWVIYLSRTTFQFYAVVFTPFLILAVAIALHRFWRTGLVSNRREVRERAIAIFVVLAFVLALYFATLWMGIPVPYWVWRIQMWFPFWI